MLAKAPEPVQKITIVPRTMGALGYVMNITAGKEMFLKVPRRRELEARLVELMGDR